MYEHILVPTDGSEPSERAVDHAIDLAAQCGATVDALFVVDERGPGGHWDMAVERREAVGEAALDGVGEAADAVGVRVEKHLRRGTPHEEICAAATDYGVDLIVMGTHGRTGLDRVASVGSVTERVVRLTQVPVLVIGGAGVEE